MSKNVQIIVSAGICIFVLGTIIFYISKDSRSVQTSDVATTTSDTVTSGNIEYDTKPNTTVVEDDSAQVSPKTPPPSLDREIVFAPNVPAEVKADMQARILEVIKNLRKNPSDFSEWINLGLHRSSINDFEGARQAWEYASLLRPSNSLSFGNLGFLYGYQLKLPTKAEENYKKAVANDSHLLYLWVQFFEFYRDVMKDKVKAEKVINDASIANPESKADLGKLLNTLYQ